LSIANNITMPYLKSVFIVLLLFIDGPSFAQNGTRKSWSATDSLQWSDFRGPVDPSSRFDASTHSGVSYTFSRNADLRSMRFIFTTASFMDRLQSWAKADKQTPELLSHERLHFDISEFFARKMLEAFNAHSYTTNYRDEIEKIFKQMMEARQTMEDLYDEQSNHFVNKAKQAEWARYVADLLSNNYTYQQALEKEPVAK